MIINKNTMILFVTMIPIINAIADTTQDYMEGFVLGTGNIRVILLMLFIVINFFNFLLNTTINKLIIINLIYFFLIALFATDMSYTFKIYTKYFLSTMMFILGYYYIRNIEDYKRLLKNMMIALFIIVVSIVIANIFHLGTTGYAEESSIYFGAGRVNITKQMVVLLLMFPLVFMLEKDKKARKIYVILFIVAAIFVFLGIKRTALLSFGVGFIIYLLLAPNGLKLIRKYIYIIVLFILSLPLYLNELILRFEAREIEGRFDLAQAPSEEARFLEVIRVLNEFREGDIFHKLFGSELFNYMEFANALRMLHTDYATIFSGAGIFGLLIFIFIYIFIFKKVLIYRKIFKNNKLYKAITATLIAMLVVLVILGIAGTVHSIGVRAIVFLFVGASLGLLRQEYINIKKGLDWKI